MKRRNRNSEIFSLSFLDVVTCGFGAIILLLLVTKSGLTESDHNLDISALLRQTFQTEDQLKRLSSQLDQLQLELDQHQASNQEMLVSKRTFEAMLKQWQAKVADLKVESSGLELVEQTLKRASISEDLTRERDQEIGGIPVDSNYVIFIIDTSGSMKQIWAQVMQTVENILDIHPQVQGFQIMNDNGIHLIAAYRKKWIPDTPKRRKGVLKAMRTWETMSNSSPVEGLEVALRTYADANKKMSIYVFGDDYTGASYDHVIRTLGNLNINKANNEPIVRIHAVGFPSQHGSGRFGTLMREVTKRNDGVFLAMPITG